VVFLTQPTKVLIPTTDYRQVISEKLTKPVRNRQNLKKAVKKAPKSLQKTDNKLYISGSAFAGACEGVTGSGCAKLVRFFEQKLSFQAFKWHGWGLKLENKCL